MNTVHLLIACYFLFRPVLYSSNPIIMPIKHLLVEIDGDMSDCEVVICCRNPIECNCFKIIIQRPQRPTYAEVVSGRRKRSSSLPSSSMPSSSLSSALALAQSSASTSPASNLPRVLSPAPSTTSCPCKIQTILPFVNIHNFVDLNISS